MFVCVCPPDACPFFLPRHTLVRSLSLHAHPVMYALVPAL